MRSLRLRVTHLNNKDTCLNELTAQCFNFYRLRSKASPIHPSFRFEPCAQFFHTSPFLKVGAAALSISMVRGCHVRHGTHRASPWSPMTIPDYANRRWNDSVRKHHGFVGSSTRQRNPPKHGKGVAGKSPSGVTHSSTAKTVVSCVGG